MPDTPEALDKTEQVDPDAWWPGFLAAVPLEGITPHRRELMRQLETPPKPPKGKSRQAWKRFKWRKKLYDELRCDVRKLHGKTPLISEWRRRRAAKVCMKCPGYCCKYFSVPFFGVEKVDEKLVLLVPDMSEALTELFTSNAIHLTHGPHRECAQIIGTHWSTYSCSLLKNGLCSCYETRPKFCQDFVCGPALEGRLPSGKPEERVQAAEFPADWTPPRYDWRNVEVTCGASGDFNIKPKKEHQA